MVEDAVEAIGFGKFQWKLSVLTGLAWASISGAVAQPPRNPHAAPLGFHGLQERTQFFAHGAFA